MKQSLLEIVHKLNQFFPDLVKDDTSIQYEIVQDLYALIDKANQIEDKVTGIQKLMK